MSAESAADRAGLTSTDDFGVTAVWTVSGTPFSVPVVLNDGAFETSRYEGPRLLSHEGEMALSVEDLPSGSAQENSVSVGGLNYVVRSILPDGTGMVFVLMERV